MPLSATACALLGLVAWALLLVVLLGNTRAIKVFTGQKAVNSFAADGTDMPGFGQRLTRAHANCLENLPLQAPVLLYAMVAGQTAVTDPLAMTLLGARLFQTSMHLISTSPLFVWLRFAAFLTQVVILAFWLLKLAGLIG